MNYGNEYLSLADAFSFEQEFFSESNRELEREEYNQTEKILNEVVK